MKIEESNNENNEIQINNENSDIVYTHVNDCDIESFQIDEKDEANNKTNSTTAATSTTTTNNESTEKDANKKSDENKINNDKQLRQERLARIEREKMYKLPQLPQIIVHPSKTAKSGKFECQLLSLSHLLDYRKDDNKESAFEVSLFAEYFNEMLIRDFGFNIYKSLLSIRTDKDKELFALAATTTANSNKRKLSVSAGGSSDITNSDNETIIKRSKSNEEDKPQIDDEQPTINKLTTEVQKEETNLSQPQQQATAIIKPTTTTTIQLTKPKPKTVYPELLLSFVFFDTNRTNYINEKDLEDLLLCIGLSLSRSKIKSLMLKISFKDKLLNYRLLTDKTSKEMTECEYGVNFSLPTDDEIISSKYLQF
jgi:hypothetical protein